MMEVDERLIKKIEKKKLKENNLIANGHVIVKTLSDQVAEEIAQKIIEADYLIIAAGAGFSQDSGLLVYKDIADVEQYRKENLTYPALCSPRWLENGNTSTFYGFHGSCYNAYKNTIPHQGYTVIKKWKETIFDPKLKATFTDDKNIDDLKINFHIYTSNVDGHFEKSGFKQEEINPIHGDYIHWQCERSTCSQPIIRPPDSFRFDIHPTLLKAIDGPIENATAECVKIGFNNNHPKCPTCGRYLRPNILMFGDNNWKTRGEGASYMRESNCYSFCRGVERNLQLKDSSKQLVILEMGCGTRIPSIRKNVASLASSIAASGNEGNVTLIRLNPGELYKSYDYPKTYRVDTKALAGLILIDKFVQEKLADKSLLPIAV